MARQYNMWNRVTSCIYKSSKSYGARDTNEFIQYVGSSRSNSHEHLTFLTTKRLKDDKWLFITSIDGVIIKKTVFSNKNGKPNELLYQESLLINIERKI